MDVEMVRFSSTEFRRVMGTFCTGVTVVTTPEGPTVHGMTANAFTSVSLEPPLILVSVDKKAHTHENIRITGRFGVNILRANQAAISDHFAKKLDPDVEKQLSYQWIEDIPVLADCLANIACRLWQDYDGGDHTLYLGEVVHLRANEGDPLVFFRGKYVHLNVP
jgi:flavin reductase (DIM6/NTAB) family NADH-FMN oxidoreductase RutF